MAADVLAYQNPETGEREGPPDNPWTTVTRWLVVVNVAVFVLDYFILRQGRTLLINGHPVTPVQPLIAYYGSFSFYEALMQAQVWRFVTYQFCHANLEHIFVNMLGLMLAGPLVEQRLGRMKYLLFYLLCGIAGPVAHIALSYFGILTLDIFTPLVGASASIYGVLVAAARIAPEEIVEIIFPPIDLKMRTLVLIMIGLSLAAVLARWNNAGGHAAHLGGAVMGYFLIRRMIQQRIHSAPAPG